MGKKGYLVILFITLAVNVVMLQWTIDSFLGREYEKIMIFSGVAIVMSFVALMAYLQWRKIEYKS
ncbi:hypothetical protein LGQ02_14140 [Bacillus shivajii]|uniref:hypothetical protein n=1 Tax=Bacillus shivajii TaxID=1983719 RepID=UPI001CFB05D7|nr:hypothetical protein [Bacillus shivajii]UCZ51985.1 hypothetical protein LGQ02_14140 [Bacillus shivajii]